MKKIAAMVMIMCIVLASGVASNAAIDCDTVTAKLAPCIGYLAGGDPLTAACCSGIKSLNSQASTPADRRTACTCLKSAAGSISGINDGLAAGLPSKCGVSVPYKISVSTNCSTVN